MSHSEAPFSRVAILNRGEPALRFLRGLREYNLEHGTSLSAIAFYTDPDSQAPFVRLADEAVPLGPALVEVAPGNMTSAYCAHESVLALLKKHNCDAVWPGWGFVSEDAAFVEKLEKAGVIFLGPSSKAMRALGDKIASKQLAETSGVPLAPWHDITTSSDDEILAFAEDIGFPLMVKASAGGGGRGIRKITKASDLLAGVKSAGDEARKAFGDGGLFIEKCIDNARHVEVQLVADSHGGAWAIGVRDCSIQRRNQKVLEETPSPVLPADKEEELLRASERLVLAAGYHGVGTAEYLYRPEDGTLAFLEVNSRLQVEHTITEQTTGADLVAAQISIALGEAWTAPEGSRGWALEARLNAEDPERGFAPSPGLVRVFRPPSGPGIRVDSGVVEGMMIAPEFDSMIAKVISWGASRPQAIARMQRALAEMEVVIENGATNKAFLLQLLSTEAVIDGSASTQWLDKAVEERSLAPAGGDQQALLVAAVISFRIEHGADMQRFFAESQMGVPQNLSSPAGRKVSLRLRGKRLDVMVFETGRDRYTVVSEEGERRVRVESTGAHAALLEVDGRRHRVTYADGRSGISVEIDGVAHAVERSTGGEVRAQAPAMVVSVSVEAGQAVEVGDRLVTLEAMKMEMPVFAQEAGTVQAVLCRPNQQVIAGQAMVVVKPEEREGQSDDAIALETSPIRPIELLFAEGAPKPETLDEAPDEIVDAFIDDVVEACRSVLLGFDVTAKIEGLIDTLFGADLQFHHVNKKGPWMRLVLLMEEFANVEALFRRDAIPDASSAVSLSPELAFYEFCRCHHLGDEGVPAPIDAELRRALACYGVTSLDDTLAVREALYRMAVAHAHTDLRHRVVSSLLRLLIGLHDSHIAFDDLPGLQRMLDHVAEVASSKHPYVADNARQASYVTVRQAHYVTADARVEAALDTALDAWREAGGEVEQDQLEFAIASAQTVLPAILRRIRPGDDASVGFVDAAVRRLYELRDVERIAIEPRDGFWLGQFTLCATEQEPQGERLVVAVANAASLAATMDRVMSAATQQSSVTAGEQPAVDLLLSSTEEVGHIVKEVEHLLEGIPQSRRRVKRLTVTWFDAAKVERHRTYQFDTGRYEEMTHLRDIHPEAARRIRVERLSEFVLERLPSPERIHAFRGVARSNPKDDRVFVIAEVFGRATPPEGQEDTWPRWEFEKVFYQGIRILREAQAKRTRRTRLFRNRMTIFLHPELQLDASAIPKLAQRLEVPTRRLGLDGVHILSKTPAKNAGDAPREVELVISKLGQHRLDISTRAPHAEPVRAMTRYEQRVVRARRLGYLYPYEVIRMLEGSSQEAELSELPVLGGTFQEYDVSGADESFVAVDRPYGENTCGVVVGRMTNRTEPSPDGIERVLIMSDPTRSMGALSEDECRRIVGAIDLAESLGVPIEWVAISAGARISMGSGTENLDWTARVLRRIIEFTQRQGEVHVIVPGVNVGAQSYWNAEATMLMHTAGVLIMTPEGSMVLTGKKALEYSGSVAAEDERGIGGYERIMGPNGQAQYVARDLGDAYRILFSYYRFAYKRMGEPRARLATTDPSARSIMSSPYTAGGPFERIGQIFENESNPGRKQPFAIREVMRAVADADCQPIERWHPMRNAETVVVWDGQVGGFGVSLIGIESQPLPRFGRVPVDGPDTWSGGTLFPQGSKKLARALNAASGRRPVVVLANLSGFDGSPESLRELQLEYGAEIGRAVVNFDGPIVFVIVGRYHGGAYVVFSKALNPNLRALALEGTYASVIGGAPAAAVVFPREVNKRAEEDERVVAAAKALEGAAEVNKPRLREELNELLASVVLEHQGKLAAEFDAIHSVGRAVEVGSLDAVIAPAELRPRIISELENAAGK